jgi:hypothetical protein
MMPTLFLSQNSNFYAGSGIPLGSGMSPGWPSATGQTKINAHEAMALFEGAGALDTPPSPRRHAFHRSTLTSLIWQSPVCTAARPPLPSFGPIPFLYTSFLYLYLALISIPRLLNFGVRRVTWVTCLFWFCAHGILDRILHAAFCLFFWCSFGAAFETHGLKQDFRSLVLCIFSDRLAVILYMHAPIWRLA